VVIVDSVNKNEFSTDTLEPTVVIAAKTIAPDSVDPKPVIEISPDTLVQNEMHFYVQTGAFRLLTKAKKHAAELAETVAYPSGIVVGDGFYKTIIGYFKTKDEAEACKDSLKKRGMVSFIGQSLYYGYQKNKNLKSGAYYVGVGSFRGKKNAIDYSRKVNETGSFESGIIVEDGLYKVRLGYFENRNAAKANMEEAIEKGLKAVIGESESYIYSGTLVPEIN
jgi:cell division protein FtsN